MANVPLPEISQAEAINELWNKGKLSWKLNSAQKEIHNAFYSSKYRIPVINASRRIGKSYTLLTIAIEHCIKIPHATVHYACPTAEMAKKIIIPTMRMLLVDCPSNLRPKYIRNDKSFVFPNGSKIQIEGTDNGNAERLRGTSSNLAIVDEAGFITDLQYLIDDILLPQTLTTNGKLLLSSTPPKSTSHAFVTIFIKKAIENEAYSKFSIEEVLEKIKNDPYHLRKHLDPKIVEELKDNYGGENSPTWRREFMVEIITDSTHSVVPEFTSDLRKQIVKEWPRPAYYDAYTSMDPGVIDFTGVLFGYLDFRNSVLVIEDEFIANGREVTTEAIAAAIKSKEMVLWKECKSKHKVYMRVSDNEPILLNDLNQLHDLIFYPARKDDKEAAINDVRIKLMHKKIIINPRCKNLLFQLESATWNKRRTSFNRTDDGGHYDLCFLPGTTVMTDVGIKNIEDIVPGDKVLTHTGTYKKVIKNLNRPYEGDITVIKASGREPIKCTPEHKLYVSESYRSTENDFTGQKQLKSPEWKQAKDLIPNTDFLYAPLVNNSKTIDISKEMAFLIGYYVAEGSIGGNGSQISFAGHKKETNVINVIQEAVNDKYGFKSLGLSKRAVNRRKKTPITRKPRKFRDRSTSSENGRQIYCRHNELAQELAKLKSGKDKQFPEYISQLDSEQAFYMLMGYIFGDGHFSKQGLVSNTISKNIAYGVETLALICGISSNIRLQKRAGRWKGLSSTGLIKNDSYVNHFTKQTTQLILDKLSIHEDLSRIFKQKLINPMIINNKKHFGVNNKRVHSINYESYSGPVFSMEVEEDHSYTVNGVVAKNCDALIYMVRHVQWNKNPHPNKFVNLDTHFYNKGTNDNSSSIVSAIKNIFLKKR